MSSLKTSSCMGAYKHDVVFVGCLYSWGAYFVWVLIIMVVTSEAAWNMLQMSTVLIWLLNLQAHPSTAHYL